jgi:integrase
VARPPLPLGTLGMIRFCTEADGSHTARAKYRDHDGTTRHIERTRATKAAAERALKEAARDRIQSGLAGSGISRESRFSLVAVAWWTEYSRRPRSPGTLQRYRDRLDRQILPGLGNLRLTELTTGAFERFLRTVETRHGSAMAKMTRNVCSGICAYAARYDILDRNLVRDTTPISVLPKKGPPRALTAAEARLLRAVLTYDDQAIARDVVDLVDGILMTGLRVGEVMAITWPDLDLDAGLITTGGVVIRVRGEGLIIRRSESSKIKNRVLRIPSWGIALLRRRYDAAADRTGPVFCAANGGLRDPSNSEHHLKTAFTNAGFPWLTSHVLRKTVATLMDRAGLTARDAADQLGHAQVSMTSNVYFGRERIVTAGAPVLEELAN